MALVPPNYTEPEDPFNAEIELGMQYTSGNTDSSNFNSRSKLNYDVSKYHHETVLKAYFASDSKDTTAEQYAVQYQLDYDLRGSKYIYGRGELNWDRFGSFTQKQSYSFGYGYSPIDRRHTKLSLEVGAGYRYNKPNTDDSTEESQSAKDEGIVRMASKFEQRLHEYTTFNLDGAVESGNRNTIATLKASLRNHLWANLALKIGIDVEYTDKVPESTEQTDIISTVNLLYKF